MGWHGKGTPYVPSPLVRAPYGNTKVVLLALSCEYYFLYTRRQGLHDINRDTVAGASLICSAGTDRKYVAGKIDSDGG